MGIKSIIIDNGNNNKINFVGIHLELPDDWILNIDFPYTMKTLDGTAFLGKKDSSDIRTRVIIHKQDVEYRNLLEEILNALNSSLPT